MPPEGRAGGGFGERGVGGGQWRWGLKGGVALACLTGGGALRRGGGDALWEAGGGDLRGAAFTIWHSATAASSSRPACAASAGDREGAAGGSRSLATGGVQAPFLPMQDDADDGSVRQGRFLVGIPLASLFFH